MGENQKKMSKKALQGGMIFFLSLTNTYLGSGKLTGQMIQVQQQINYKEKEKEWKRNPNRDALR